MPETSKRLLLEEIRGAEGRQVNADPLTGLVQRWLECQDAQAAGNALARALSLQGRGDPIFPGPGIWPIPPA